MNVYSTLRWLVCMILVLGQVAAVAGLWPGEGQPYPLTSFRGEAVTINARGLYYWDTVSIAAQSQASDLTVLILGLPLLAISLWLAGRGSLRGRLLLAGTLGFILYTYVSMCFGAAYNKMFLVYVALLGLSLFSLILTMMSFDLKALPGQFERAPRRAIAALLFFVAGLLSLNWLGQIAPTIAQDQIPELENTTSLFIQAMDLGVVVPVCVVAGVLLLRRRALGYLLASVAVTKFVTIGIGVCLMGANQARVGVPVTIAEMIPFAAITLVSLAGVVGLFRSIVPVATEQASAPGLCLKGVGGGPRFDQEVG